MARTKKDRIQELIDQAQDNVWKNELVIEYRKANPTDEKKDAVDIKATEDVITKDTKYIEFLRAQLDETNN